MTHTGWHFVVESIWKIILIRLSFSFKRRRRFKFSRYAQSMKLLTFKLRPLHIVAANSLEAPCVSDFFRFKSFLRSDFSKWSWKTCKISKFWIKKSTFFYQRKLQVDSLKNWEFHTLSQVPPLAYRISLGPFITKNGYALVDGSN